MAGESKTGRHLSPEEEFLWLAARRWREPESLAEIPSLDWEQVVRLGLTNRMQVILKRILAASSLLETLPDEARSQLLKGAARNAQTSEMLKRALSEYLYYAAAEQQDVVVIKGLWLSEKIYGVPDLRPGADIDLLLRQKDIAQSLAILEEKMGYGTWWRPLLDDRYYQKHHLHQQRCNHDRSIWIEPHWRLDHPYNTLTIDYDALFDRSKPGMLWDLPLVELSPVDQLLVLSIHLVKHAVYLPSALDRDDLRRLILADGMLMYYLDVSEVIRHYQDEIEWDEVSRLAQETGTNSIMGSVLRVCQGYLETMVPTELLSDLPVAGSGRLTRTLMTRLADAKVAESDGRQPGKIWSFLLGYHPSIIFRPIRLLDMIYYLFPDGDFLIRRYGEATWRSRASHLLKAMGQYLRILWDTVYFTSLRRLEVRKLDRQGYHWPDLPHLDE